MNLIQNKATLRNCCRLVMAARRHLGLKAKLVFDGEGEGHVEIDAFCVIPERIDEAIGPFSLQRRVNWQLSVFVPRFGVGHWDPPDCDVVELGDHISWASALVEIASLMARERLDNLLAEDDENIAIREAAHYERLMSS